MKLSIITVNLNNAIGLKKTMDSVFAQAWQEFEYIIVDGASTDGSKELIERQCKTKEDLKWISEPDSGVFQAMNKGIRMASGEYLLFLNSGDYLVDEYVLKTIFSKAHAVDFIVGTLRLCKNNQFIGYFKPDERITFQQLYNSGLPHQASFIRKDTFERYGLYLENFKYNADIEYWIRCIILNACSTEVIDLVVSDYNMDGISSIDSKTDAYLNEMRQIFAHPFLQAFLPDYELFKKEQRYRYLWNWIQEHQLVFWIMLTSYKIAKKFGYKVK